MQDEVTLALLIGDWARERGLRWMYNPKLGRLVMQDYDPFDFRMIVDTDHVSFYKTHLLDATSIKLVAADPDFFKKLEAAMRYEEKWSHFGKVVKLLADALLTVWYPITDPFFKVVWKVIDGATSMIGKAYKRLAIGIKYIIMSFKTRL